jgi:hypothetical protein
MGYAIIVGLLLFMGLWVTCGYFAHGYVLGFFTARYPDQEHESFAREAYFFGPVALVSELLNPDRHYLQTPLTREQRWEHFHNMYPALGREYFEANCK